MHLAFPSPFGDAGDPSDGGKTMARAIWKARASAWPVNIPVGLYAAESRDDISFKMLDKKTMSPIHYKRASARRAARRSLGGDRPRPSARRRQVRGALRRGSQGGRPLRRRRRSTSPTSSIPRRSARSTSTSPTIWRPTRRSEGLRAAARDATPHQQSGDRQGGDPHRQYLAAVVARGDVMTLELMRYAHELRAPEIPASPTAGSGGHRPRARDGRAPGRGDGRRLGAGEI